MKLSEIKKLQETNVMNNEETFNFIQKLKSSFDKNSQTIRTELKNFEEYTSLYNNLFNSYYSALMKKLEIANKYNTESSSSKNYQNLTINLNGIINPIPKVNYNIEEIQQDNKDLEAAEQQIQDYAIQIQSCENRLIDLIKEINKRTKSIMSNKEDIEFNFMSFYD